MIRMIEEKNETMNEGKTKDRVEDFGSFSFSVLYSVFSCVQCVEPYETDDYIYVIAMAQLAMNASVSMILCIKV